MLLLAKPIGWFLTRYGYRWLALMCVWLVLLVALFPLLWLDQQAYNAGGLWLALLAVAAEILFLGVVALVAIVATLYRIAKSLRAALGLAPPKQPKVFKQDQGARKA